MPEFSFPHNLFITVHPRFAPNTICHLQSNSCGAIMYFDLGYQHVVPLGLNAFTLLALPEYSARRMEPET
jgi:hypothetical protein